MEHLFMLEEGTPPGNPPATPPSDGDGTTPPNEPPKVDDKELRKQVLRDVSKELGVNLFEADGIKQVKELIDSQKSEQQRLQEQVEAYQQREAEWNQQQTQFKAQLKASELGIAKDKVEDALKLAGGDPDKLADVIKKYPIFRDEKGVQIGFQNPNNTTPPSGTQAEVEAYMANNPLYKKWHKK